MRVRAAKQQCRFESPANEFEPLEAILEGSLVEEQLGPGTEGSVAPKRSQFHVEYVFGHAGPCAVRSAGRQAAI
jgi:hypothetical protein